MNTEEITRKTIDGLVVATLRRKELKKQREVTLREKERLADRLLVSMEADLSKLFSSLPRVVSAKNLAGVPVCFAVKVDGNCINVWAHLGQKDRAPTSDLFLCVVLSMDSLMDAPNRPVWRCHLARCGSSGLIQEAQVLGWVSKQIIQNFSLQENDPLLDTHNTGNALLV